MAEKKDEAAETGMSVLANKVAAKADKIKYAVLAVIIVLLAIVAILSWQRRSAAARATEAANSLFKLEVESSRQPDAEAVAAFGKAAKDYAGLPAGARASVLQFFAAFEQRDFATAETAIRDFIKNYPDNIMVPRARLSLGQTLLEQNRVSDAITEFRNIISRNEPSTYAEAKLALAQALEREAEAVKDNADEYRRKLEAALEEYNDILARSRSDAPGSREFWPQVVREQAQFNQVVIKDRLAGYVHKSPYTADAAISPAELESVGVVAAPPPEVAAEPEAETKPEAEAETAAETETEAKPEAAAE